MPALPSPPITDRRIRAVLARIGADGGGEALAALAALQRLLPEGYSLADILLVGLHYCRRDLADLSLVAENRQLATRLGELGRRSQRMAARVAELEAAIAREVAAIADIAKAFTPPD